MQRLTDVVPTDKIWPELVGIEQALGREWILTRWYWREGQWGIYAVLHLSDPETGEIVAVGTGAVPIVQHLREVEDREVGPVLVKIVKDGRTYKFV